MDFLKQTKRVDSARTPCWLSPLWSLGRACSDTGGWSRPPPVGLRLAVLQEQLPVPRPGAGSAGISCRYRPAAGVRFRKVKAAPAQPWPRCAHSSACSRSFVCSSPAHPSGPFKPCGPGGPLPLATGASRRAGVLWAGSPLPQEVAVLRVAPEGGLPPSRRSSPRLSGKPQRESRSALGQ